jgi:hypothetical protein
VRKPKLLFLITAVLLSILGWAGYGYLTYITAADPNLALSGHEKKYFENSPYQLALLSLLALVTAIILITTSGFLNNKNRIPILILLILDVLLISMMFMPLM